MSIRTTLTLALAGIGCILMASAPGAAQTTVRIRGSFNRYSLRALHVAQQRTEADAQTAGFRYAKAVDTFPDHTGVQIEALVPLSGAVSLIGSIGYGSTGGRIHQLDYSGELRLDQRLSHWSGSTGIEAVPLKQGPHSIRLTLSLVALATSMKDESLIRVLDESHQETTKLISSDAGIEVGAAYQISVGPVSLNARGALLAATGRPLHLSDNDKAQLYDSGGDPVGANWSGSRLSIGMGYTF